MQLRNVGKKLRLINGALSREGQMAVIMPSDIAHEAIKQDDASVHVKLDK